MAVSALDKFAAIDGFHLMAIKGPERLNLLGEPNANATQRHIRSSNLGTCREVPPSEVLHPEFGGVPVICLSALGSIPVGTLGNGNAAHGLQAYRGC